MALFFDSTWFDNVLANKSAARADLAAAASLSLAELNEVFKDQRMLNRAEIEAFAQFLGIDPETISERAGIATPRPSQGWQTPGERAQKAPEKGAENLDIAILNRLEEVLARLDRIEEQIAKLQASHN